MQFRQLNSQLNKKEIAMTNDKRRYEAPEIDVVRVNPRDVITMASAATADNDVLAPSGPSGDGKYTDLI